MTLEQGALLHNRYRIVEVLGQGGMGAVYHAVDDNLGVDVAVKENLYLTAEYSQQFKREATILAGLRHSNLPRVGDHFTIEGQGQYLVMDFIAGEDLRQRMERVGQLSEEDAIRIGAAVCEALDFLHNRPCPIIHRDIKPGNIKITPDGQIVLVDFGLAKMIQSSQNTATGARAMTPGYSPPEQYGTAHTDARSDVYSLAATLYSALTGVIPEDGLARATGSVELTSMRTRVPKLNRRIAAVIEKGLAVQPHERYQTAREFKAALLDSLSSTRGLRVDYHLSAAPAPSGLEVIEGELVSTGQSAALARPSQVSYTRPVEPWTTGSNWLALALLVVLLGSGAWILFNPDHPNNILPVAAIPSSTPTTGLAPTLPCSGDGCLALSGFQLSGSPTQAGAVTTGAVTTAPSPGPTSKPHTPAPTAVGGGPGEIAFASDRTGIPQIWIMNSAGEQLFQVTNLVEGACQPSWSPDGQRLVFTSPCRGKRDVYERSSLYMIDRSGENLTALPASPEGDFDPAWSPDGKRIAFTTILHGQTKIATLTLADQKVELFSQSPYSDKQPAWSADSSLLAFVRSRTSLQVWVAAEDGQGDYQFSRSGDINDQWPAWSPDGLVIYYSQNPDLRPIPWLMGMRYEDGGTSKGFRVSPVNAPEYGPITHASPSPDGAWILFESWPDGVNHDIYRMTTSAASLLRLTNDPGVDFDPVWRPE